MHIHGYYKKKIHKERKRNISKEEMGGHINPCKWKDSTPTLYSQHPRERQFIFGINQNQVGCYNIISNIHHKKLRLKTFHSTLTQWMSSYGTKFHKYIDWLPSLSFYLAYFVLFSIFYQNCIDFYTPGVDLYDLYNHPYIVQLRANSDLVC